MLISPWQKAVNQSRRSSLSSSLCCISFHKATKLEAKGMFIRKLACLSLWYHVCPTKADLWLIAVGNANGCNGSFACCFSASRACTRRHGPTIPSRSALCITTSWQRKNILHRRTTPHLKSTCSPRVFLLHPLKTLVGPSVNASCPYWRRQWSLISLSQTMQTQQESPPATDLELQR